jgi:hypothetical protein
MKGFAKEIVSQSPPPFSDLAEVKVGEYFLGVKAAQKNLPHSLDFADVLYLSCSYRGSSLLQKIIYTPTFSTQFCILPKMAASGELCRANSGIGQRYTKNSVVGRKTV